MSHYSFIAGDISSLLEISSDLTKIGPLDIYGHLFPEREDEGRATFILRTKQSDGKWIYFYISLSVHCVPERSSEDILHFVL